MVITLTGEVVESDNFRHIIHDIALLSSLGIRLVLIHGARPQIQQRLELRALESHIHNNIRITDVDALEAVKDASGSIRCSIEAMLSLGLPNSPMHGATLRVTGGNYITAKPMGVHDGIDFQHTGTVRNINAAAITQQLDCGDIVLISPLGYSPTGEIFNMPAEDLAMQTALAINADKLIYLDNSEGIFDANSQLVAQLSIAEAKQLSALSDHQQHVVNAAINASSQGIERVHIISNRIDGTLLRELFTRDGCGTMVYADSYDVTRKASINDVGGILNLIRPLEQQGILVRRSREHLETEIEQFVVIERDGMVIGCAALYCYPEDNLAELACVVTHPEYRGGERGERLLYWIESEAKKLGMARLFVLTTQTAHWFREQGFDAADTAQLPTQKQQLYNYQRNSKVFIKAL